MVLKLCKWPAVNSKFSETNTKLVVQELKVSTISPVFLQSACRIHTSLMIVQLISISTFQDMTIGIKQAIMKFQQVILSKQPTSQ